MQVYNKTTVIFLIEENKPDKSKEIKTNASNALDDKEHEIFQTKTVIFVYYDVIKNIQVRKVEQRNPYFYRSVFIILKESETEDIFLLYQYDKDKPRPDNDLKYILFVSIN